MKKFLLAASLCLLTACTQTAVIEAHYGYYLYQGKTYDTFTDIPIPENTHVKIGLVKATEEQEQKVKKEVLQHYGADEVTFYPITNSAHYMLPPEVRDKLTITRINIDDLLGEIEKEAQTATRHTLHYGIDNWEKQNVIYYYNEKTYTKLADIPIPVGETVTVYVPKLDFSGDDKVREAIQKRFGEANIRFKPSLSSFHQDSSTFIDNAGDSYLQRNANKLLNQYLHFKDAVK